MASEEKRDEADHAGDYKASQYRLAVASPKGKLLHSRNSLTGREIRKVCPELFHSIFAYYSPMGSERASTTRQRIAGRICAICSNPIDLGMWPSGERRCDRCAGTHRVYVTFTLRGDAWVCSFVETDLKTPIGRVRQFGSAHKLRELIARTPTRFDLAGKQALEHAIQGGRGGLYLHLTDEQYKALKP
jgi:hypothetical protein